VLRGLEAVAGLAYPFVVYLGLQMVSTRTLAAVLAVLVIARAGRRLRRASWAVLAPVASAGAVVLTVVTLAALFDDGRVFTLVPVVVNLGLFVAFARSLVSGGPSLVESFARLQYRTLPAEAAAYCRRVTALWCVFFVLNAAFTFWLALRASLAAWTLYTGLLAYVVVGALFALEHVYRAWRYRHYEDGLADVVLRRIFPPRPAAR
jgi:uncharacterized membrane protein